MKYRTRELARKPPGNQGRISDIRFRMSDFLIRNQTSDIRYLIYGAKPNPNSGEDLDLKKRSKNAPPQKGGFFMALSSEIKDKNLISYPSRPKLPEVFKKFGSTESLVTDLGDLVTILPTCDVPVRTLYRERWRNILHLGNRRPVKLVQQLDDGSNPGIIAKSPERIFTAEEREFKRGNVWWGGKRSGERKSSVIFHPLVEQQSVWEAAILLELDYLKTKAEIPQAIITHLNGQQELVVKEIPKSINVYAKGPNIDEILKKIKQISSLVPIDASNYNAILDPTGFIRIIDVNQWKWPPFTDEYYQNLIEVIKKSCMEKAA